MIYSKEEIIRGQYICQQLGTDRQNLIKVVDDVKESDDIIATGEEQQTSLMTPVAELPALNIKLPFRLVLREEIRHRHLWAELFQPSTENFFLRYPRFIEIDVIANNAEDHRAW